MLLRHMSGAANLNEALLRESATLAKEAARLEPSSSRAWSGLGAAHLSLHINVTGVAEDLHVAHRAFTQAARVATRASAEQNADLHLNHAMVLSLLDRIDDAFAHYQAAHELDPALGAEAKRAEAWSEIVRVSEVSGA